MSSYDARTVAVLPAATVVVARDQPDSDSPKPRLEVLLCRRRRGSEFVSNMQVFPGGGIDPADSAGRTAPRGRPGPFSEGPSVLAARRAAVREAEEETGLRLGNPEQLPLIGRWITPALAPRRYDTLFFVAALPPDQTPVPDGTEVIECTWWRPGDAVNAWVSGELEFVTPTLRFLMSMRRFDSTASLLAAADAANADDAPLPQRVRVDDETGWPWLPQDEAFWGDGLRRSWGWVGLR